jgi:hypothetical protein
MLPEPAHLAACYEICSVFFTVCTVATAVKLVCEYGGRTNPDPQSY